MKNILIVDDEREIRELLKVYLKNNGYNTFEASDGQEAINILEKYTVDLVLTDIMMPKLDGMEFVKRVRQDSVIPIIFLSAKSEYMDKILGLQSGADDYIAKPFNPLEVISRVQALFRRMEKYTNYNKQNSNDIITIGDITLDSTSCQVYKGGNLIEMTSYEFKIIQLFIQNPGRVYSKAQIYETIWKEEYLGDENIIMVYISKLREKIENNPKKPQYLTTIRGLGYRFERIGV